MTQARWRLPSAPVYAPIFPFSSPLHFPLDSLSEENQRLTSIPLRRLDAESPKRFYKPNTSDKRTSFRLPMNRTGVASSSAIGESQRHARTHFCCPLHDTVARTMRGRVNPLQLVNPRGCERPSLPG